MLYVCNDVLLDYLFCLISIAVKITVMSMQQQCIKKSTLSGINFGC